MSALNPTARDLAKLLTRLEARTAALEAGARTSQLQHASLTGTAITVYDQDGVTPRGAIGIQPDGTLGLVAEGGPAPSAPTAPLVTPSLGGLSVVWDGALADGSALPADFDHVAVHVSTTSGFTPSAATFVGTITRSGDGGTLPVTPLPYQAHYVVLVAVNSSGIGGAPSTETAATPVQVDGPDLAAGSVTAAAIEAGAVTASKLEAVLQLVTRLVAGDPAGARVELNADGLRVYNASGELVIQFNSADGSGAFTGEITGSTITGSTITGSTIKTAATGQRIAIQPTGTPGENTIELYSGVASEIEPGALLASVNTASGHPRPILELDSPDVEPGTSAYLRLIAGGGTDNDQGEWELSTGPGSGSTTRLYAYAADGGPNLGQITAEVQQPGTTAGVANLNITGDTLEWVDANGVSMTHYSGSGSPTGLYVTSVYATGRIQPDSGESSNLTLQNGWTNFDATNYGVARVRKTATGLAYLVGRINAGTTTSGTLVATLPSGYWPPIRHAFPNRAPQAASGVTILVNELGEIRIFDIAGAITNLPLSGIIWPLF